MLFNRTVHTSNKFSNLLINLCPRMLLEPFTLDTCSATSWDTFSCARQFHSPEVAAASRFVAAHVASVKGLGHKLSNKFGNLCPSPFTLGYMFGNMLLNLFGNTWPVWKHYYMTKIVTVQLKWLVLSRYDTWMLFDVLSDDVLCLNAVGSGKSRRVAVGFQCPLLWNSAYVCMGIWVLCVFLVRTDVTQVDCVVCVCVWLWLVGWQVRYLGNVLTAIVKGDGCVDRPIIILWNNYNALTTAGPYLRCLYINVIYKSIVDSRLCPAVPHSYELHQSCSFLDVQL